MALTNFPDGINPGNWKYGSTVLTGGGTINSGLSAVSQVITSLSRIGTAAGDPFTCSGTPSGGSIIFSIRQQGGALATVPVPVHWIAVGTPA